MSDDPNQIAEQLIEQHGADGALAEAMEGKAAAHADGDNYRLSVWRDVSRVLRSLQDTDRKALTV